MRTGLGLVLLIPYVFTSFATAAVLIDTDFGKASQRIHDGNKPERVTGVAPEGWRDNSSWAKVWTDCSVKTEERRSFLRLNVERRESGWFQLSFSPLPAIEDESYFRLGVRLRNQARATVTLGIRMQGAPYKMHWSTAGVFAKDWQTHNYDFVLTRSTQPIGFWILIDGTGPVDLAFLKLERLSRKQLIAEIKQRHPDGGPANLMRNSRFPLGIQSGWSLDRERSDGDEVTLKTDEKTIGPSRAPALMLLAPKPITLRVEPFGVVLPLMRHKAAMSVKGEGEWTFSIHVGGRRLGSKTAKLLTGADWKRLEIGFMPKLMAKVYEWRITGKGKLWLDALQVGPETKVHAYESAGACEVALALPETEASCARVQFGDEAGRVRYCVSGKSAGAVLKSKVVNLYGEAVTLPDVKIGQGVLNYGHLIYDRFPKKPWGAFRVEAWVERDKRRVSPVNELVVFRLHRPRHWMGDAPNSPFGVHTNSTRRHILMAKAVGVNWTRLHDAGLQYFGWWMLEPEQGQWRFFDAELARYRKYGMHIFAELGTAPKWASYWKTSGRKQFGYFDKFFQPRDLNDYKTYVQTVAQRYKGVIDAYDVWNEPWIHAWWGVDYDEARGKDRAGFVTSKEPQKDFANLMRVAYANVKAVDPTAVVAGFNSTTGGGGSRSFTGHDWTKGVLANGGLDSCDVIDYHHYTREMALFPGDGVARGLKNATGPIREKLGRLPKPVWMTEGQGAVGLNTSPFYKHTLPYEDTEDYMAVSNLLCRHVVSLLANGVDRVFLYTMHGHNYFDPKASGWRVLVTQEGYLHPSAAAHSAMAWHLEGKRFSKHVDLGGGVHAYLFAHGQEAVAVLSTAPKFDDYEIPRNPRIKATDLFGNPVEAGETLTDKIVYLSTSAGVHHLERVLAGHKTR